MYYCRWCKWETTELPNPEDKSEPPRCPKCRARLYTKVENGSCRKKNPGVLADYNDKQ